MEGWEKFVRRVQDTVSTKLWIPGSSSRLMGREIVSSLRGRALSFTLFPFSFREYLRYHGVSPEAQYATRDKNRIINHFDAFAVLSIPKYHDSPVKQEQSFKKVCVNDPGVLTAYRFSNTPDMGWYLETLSCWS